MFPMTERRIESPCFQMHVSARRLKFTNPAEVSIEQGERERERELLFKRETEHLCIRQLIHGIGRDPKT